MTNRSSLPCCYYMNLVRYTAVDQTDKPKEQCLAVQWCRNMILSCSTKSLGPVTQAFLTAKPKSICFNILAIGTIESTGFEESNMKMSKDCNQRLKISATCRDFCLVHTIWGQKYTFHLTWHNRWTVLTCDNASESELSEQLSRTNRR